MSKAWKIVGTIVLALAIAGIISAGIGLITGASIDRMVELIFGGWETLEMIVEALQQEIGEIFSAVPFIGK